MARSYVNQRLVHLVSTPGRILFTTVVGVLVILLAFTGIGQTLAVWNSQATVAGSATGAQLKLATDFGNAGATFANHRTSVTGSFTLTNQTITNSTAPGAYTATIVGPGHADLRNALTVTIWPATGAGCTEAASPANVAASGTWAQSPFAVSGNLVAGATATYCMRMEASERGTVASSSGELIINPSITASLTIGTWNASANGAVVQKTAYIFPASNPTENVWYQLVSTGNKCASVSTAGALSSVTCGAPTTQHVKFAAAGDGYQEIIPRSAASRRLDVPGAATTTGIVLNTQNVSASRPSQDWQMQFKGNVSGVPTYQIVNRHSGLCVQAATSSYSQQECGTNASQTFTLTVVGVDATLALSCTSTGGNVTYQLTGPAVGSYVFVFRTTSYATPVAPGTTSVTFTPAQIGSLLTAGLNDVRVTWLGYELTTEKVWKTGTPNSSPLLCKAPTLETVACTQSPQNSVVINWGHQIPSGTTYQIGLLAGTGGAGETQLASVSTGTSHTLTASNWADGTRTIRVTSSTGPIVEIKVAKSGGTGNNATERLWCLTDVSASITVTCDPTGSATRTSSVTVSWPTGATRGNQVMLEVAGVDDELYPTVTTNPSTGRSSFTVAANSLPNGVRVVTITRIGDNVTGGFILGTKSFDTSGNRSRCS